MNDNSDKNSKVIEEFYHIKLSFNAWCELELALKRNYEDAGCFSNALLDLCVQMQFETAAKFEDWKYLSGPEDANRQDFSPIQKGWLPSEDQKLAMGQVLCSADTTEKLAYIAVTDKYETEIRVSAVDKLSELGFTKADWLKLLDKIKHKKSGFVACWVRSKLLEFDLSLEELLLLLELSEYDISAKWAIYDKLKELDLEFETLWEIFRGRFRITNGAMGLFLKLCNQAKTMEQLTLVVFRIAKSDSNDKILDTCFDQTIGRLEKIRCFEGWLGIYIESKEKPPRLRMNKLKEKSIEVLKILSSNNINSLERLYWHADDDQDLKKYICKKLIKKQGDFDIWYGLMDRNKVLSPELYDIALSKVNTKY